MPVRNALDAQWCGVVCVLCGPTRGLSGSQRVMCVNKCALLSTTLPTTLTTIVIANTRLGLRN